MTAALAQAVATDLLVDAVIRVLGFAVLAGVTAAGTAFVYRWYTGEGIPDGVAVLAGVTVVALWLNTKSALGDAIIGETPLLDPETAVYTVVTFAASAIAADGGRRVGDSVAVDTVAAATPRTLDEVGRLVRAAGRVVAVTLPETIADADGYDPVDEETKAELAGETLYLPRRLSPDERRDRLVTRLERDYGVGGVDVSLADDGTVEFLAVGSRPSGIGPTLAPGSVAVALDADPAPDASPGDAVEVWISADGETRRVTTAELRAIAGDVATLAVDGDDVDDLPVDRSYRLVTLPGSADAGRQFVSLLRAADETITATTVDEDGPFVGTRVGTVPVAVVAVDRDGEAVALPNADERLEAGDVAYLLGRPAALRRLDER